MEQKTKNVKLSIWNKFTRLPMWVKIIICIFVFPTILNFLIPQKETQKKYESVTLNDSINKLTPSDTMVAFKKSLKGEIESIKNMKGDLIEPELNSLTIQAVVFIVEAKKS